MTDLVNDLLRLKIEAAGAAADSSDVLATLLRSKLDVRSDGTVKVLGDGGSVRIGGGPHFADMTLDELVAETAAARPVLFGRSKPAPIEAPRPATEPPAGETETAKAIRQGRERREAAAAAKAPQPQPNPWHPDSLSVTQQVLISSRDPSRAARLKAEAAALPTFTVKHP